MAFRVFRSLAEVPEDFGPSAVTIGNFDGVHLGHRALINRVVEIARHHHWKPALLTFDPHPSKVVAPGRTPHLITSMDRRIELMQQAGIRELLIAPFTIDVARLTPEEFTVKFLRETIRARAVVVGDNFRFGSKQAGDTATLARLGDEHGFKVEALSTVTWRGILVSSSEIRKRIGAGDIGCANRLLASCYGLEGEVVAGHGIGSRKTVPTLNLRTTSEVLPATGVYVTRTFDFDSARHWDSVTNIGYRPTFGGESLSIETFLLSEFDGAPPKRIRVELLRKLREERKFDTPEALKTQIFRDVSRANAYFRRIRTLY